MLIGIIGLKGSGKDTAGDFLAKEYGFEKQSFANALKDVVSVLFNWDREMLEGSTPESREQREIADPWWSEKLGMTWTPRYALQYMGTDVLRKQFFDGMWVSSVENKIATNPNTDFVITDVRFPNEMKMIKDNGGHLIQITRGPKPAWWSHAVDAVAGSQTSIGVMRTLFTGVHESEWAVSGLPVDCTFTNDGTIADLHVALNEYLASLAAAKLATVA